MPHNFAPIITKDPDAPKKVSCGAFGCFLHENRAALTKECAGQPASAATKLAGERWKKLSAKEHERFQKEYEAKKAEYDEVMKLSRTDSVCYEKLDTKSL